MWHEVNHVKWNVSLNKYLCKQNILNNEIKNIKALFSMTSEYSACFIECIISQQQQGKPQKLDLDVGIAADKIIEAYRSSLSSGLNIPNSQIEFALAEFNDIFVRQLGYYDAAGEADRFDLIIAQGKISGLFGKSVYELNAIIRDIAKETKMGLENQLDEIDLIQNANFLWDLGARQRNLLYRNLAKYS